MEPLEARDLFPIVAQHIYMNHASIAPMSERVRAALEHVMQALVSAPYPIEWVLEESQQARRLAALLINAPEDSVALTKSTAHGLSLLASGLAWIPGDNVVGAKGEFPANVYPWMALEQKGVEYRLAECQDGRVTPDAVLALMDERTRVVALSHVEFWNGFRVDLERIGRECRSRGVLLCVDAIQSAGAVQIDVRRQHIDFLSAGAYKWLLGPDFAGFCYCRPDLIEQLQPALIGAHSVKLGQNFFQYQFHLHDTAMRFEETHPSLMVVAALSAAFGLLVEIGIDKIEERVLALSDRLASGLAERGFEIVGPWPRTPEESSGIVSFRKPEAPAEEALRDLHVNGIVARVHSDFVRLSPHFYNTEEEVDRVLEVLAPEGVRA